jgi:peroxiredoxin
MSPTNLRTPTVRSNTDYYKWGMPPGARGCTPQSCSLQEHFGELKALEVDHLFGLSTQDTTYQRGYRAASPLIPAHIDGEFGTRKQDGPPTFETSGMTLLTRMSLLTENSTVLQVFYPVLPPDRSAADVVAWLSHQQAP